MFGGPLPCPDKNKKVVPRPAPELQDNLLLTVQPGHFGHLARQPDSSYKRDKLHYLQRTNEIITKEKEKQNKEIEWCAFKTKFYIHTDRRWFSREIKDRTAAKMRAYEAQLVERRDKLRELLAGDEREFNRETVDHLQKGKSLKDELTKKKVEARRKEREEEQMKIVNQKRVQQHMARCLELREHLSKKHLIESKHVQLQQMRENESHRLSEKEWDGMWEHVMKRKDEAMVNRERQEALERYNKTLEQKDALNTQIIGREMAKAEALKQKEEDRQEMRKLAEQVQREELGEFLKDQRKKAETSAELTKQMKQQRKILDERGKAEADLEGAFNYLAQLEYRKEQEMRKTSSEDYRREVAQFRRSVADIKRQRKLEDQKLEALLEADRKRIEERQDELRCKQQMAKQKLLQDVLEERGRQLIYKKEEDERERQRKQAEEDLQRAAWQTEKELEESYARRKREEDKQRLKDWQKHVDYNRALKEREKAEAERQLEIGRREEEKYRKQILETVESEIEEGRKHPFRKVLEQYDCYCKNK